MRKLFVAILFVMLVAGMAFAAYPEKNIQGYIMWGAGGACDNVTRAIAPNAGKALGKTIILQNKPGATGAIATTFVAHQPADGYNILFGSENPNLYKVTGISQIDYDEYDPIMLFVANYGIVLVPKDSPYKDFKSLIEAVKGGKKLRMGSTGPGGLAYVASSLVNFIHKTKFDMVQFDGEGPAITALMGNHIDVVAVGLIAAAPFVNSGAVKGLALIANKRSQSIKDIPAITEYYPEEYKPYLPWGAFQGAFVRKGTPKDRVETLRVAFAEAYNDPKFDTFANNMGGIKLGLTGEDAVEYIKQNQSVAAWLLYNSGGAKVSPDKFNIPEPGTKK